MTDTLVAMLIPLAGIQIAMLVHAISLIKEIKMAPPVEEQVVASLQDAAKELVGGDIKKRGWVCTKDAITVTSGKCGHCKDNKIKTMIPVVDFKRGKIEPVFD